MPKTKNILVVTQWGYEEGLIQSYTLPYLRIIHKVSPHSKIYLITQEKSGLERNGQKLEVIRKELIKDNIYLLAGRYNKAGLKKYFTTGLGFFRHVYLIFSKHIDYIHTFCTPAGGYGYLLAKATGRKLIVDSYEPHAEYMRESGVWPENSFSYRVLLTLEKKQAVHATHLIATTPSMIPYTKERFAIELDHYSVKPACVDLKKFYYHETEAQAKRTEMGLQDKIVGVYAGKFGDFYLKEEVFELLKAAFQFWGNRFHALLLSDIQPEELNKYCKIYGLQEDSITLMLTPHHLVPVYLSSGDFGISPYRPTPSKKFCTPIKNGEYWAVGLPVIITQGISVDSEIIEASETGYVLKELTQNEYLNAIRKIDALLAGDRIALRNKIRMIAEQQRSFSIAEKIYNTIYN